MKVQWHWLKDNDFPKDGQDVLCIYKRSWENKYCLWREDLMYSEDLYEFDNQDFPEYKHKHQNGFIYLDSEWGWTEILNIVAWCELPDLPEYVEGED